MFSHAHDIKIDPVIGETGYGKNAVDGINATGRGYFSMLMTTVKLSNAAINNSLMVMYTLKENANISLAKYFQKILHIHHVHKVL